MNATSVHHQGQRIARLIRRNVDAYMAHRISHATFSARQERLWRKADQGRDLIVGGERIHERLQAAVLRAM